MRLTDFDALSFDCYGTLIDWESGIISGLGPLLARAGERPREAVLEAFARHESAQQAATPGMLYPEILACVHSALAQDWGVAADAAEAARFGASVPDWPAFADSADALAYLKRHYRLIILSNIDRASFAASNRRLGVAFDAVFTAQDIGSYKPAAANFDYLLARTAALGIDRTRLLHTAQSLFHDHAPARAAGLATAWIDRRAGLAGTGATPPTQADHDFRYPTLAAMAEAHQAQAG